MKEQYKKLSVKYSKSIQEIFFEKERKEEFKNDLLECENVEISLDSLINVELENGEIIKGYLLEYIIYNNQKIIRNWSFAYEESEEIQESEITCCQWCGEEFEESEDIYKTNWGFICMNCIQALESRGEKVVIYEKI